MLTIQFLLLLHLLASPLMAFVLQEDVCKQKCEENRPIVDSDKAFTFTCHGTYNDDTCLRICEKCYGEVCDEYEQRDYQFQFYCPRRNLPRSYMPENRRRYKGKCMDRCEKGRAGGFHDFRLNCTSRYSTKQEQDLCLVECNSVCSESICYNNDTISCKEDQREARRIEKEKEEIKSMLAKEYREKQEDLYEPHRKTMIILGVLLVIVIVATIAFVWCTLRKKRVAPEVVNGRTMSMQDFRTLRDLSTSGISSSSENKQGNVQSK